MRGETPVKQVLVYRRDLKMRKGKIAAQVAHASLAVFLRRRLALIGVEVTSATGEHRELDAEHTLVVPLTEDMAAWVQGRFKKIVLSVDSEADLLRVHAMAEEAGIPSVLIRDRGLTEFGGVPTYTTVALGPAHEDLIDPITGRDGAVSTRLP